MPLRISTNVAAIAAQRHIGKNQEKMEHSLKALASGKRIVNAADDAAGLAISENLKGQVRGLQQAQRNAENAVSVIQVAEGGLNEQNNILIRLRELGVQAASDTVSDVERGFLNQEFIQLTDELDRIAKTTTFGSKKLLTGETEEFVFHVGANGGEENRIRYTLDADTTGGTLGVEGLSITDKYDAADNLEVLDAALLKIGGVRANFGAIQSRLQATHSNAGIQIENVSAAKSRIADVDFAEEAATMAQAQVLQNSSVAVLAQAANIPKNANHLIASVL